MTLAANGHGHVTSLLTPDAMSLDEIRRFELQGITGELAKSLFWRYTLGLQIAKYIVAHAKSEHRKTIPASTDKLRKFLIANGEGVDPHFHEQFWRSIQRLKTLSLGALGAKITVELEAPSEGLRTSGLLEIVEQYIMKAMADLDCPPSHPRLLLLIDQLEQVWSNDPQSDAMVTGLLLATKRVSGCFPGIRCVTFLRTDIYDVLEFAERDKFRGDEMRIDWTPGNLLDLVLARARASLGRPVSAEELWESIFPGTVDDEPSYSYLVSRTLRRPRDLIQFANLCRDTADKNGHDKIHDVDVKEAELLFSQWKIDDLGAEYKVNYPFLPDLFLPFQNSGYIISRESLAERFKPLLNSLVLRYPEISSSITLDGVIDILYGIGFLGVWRKLQAVYSYQDPARIEPTECRFYIHPCFRQALRSTTAADLQPYQPPPALLQDAEILNTAGRIGSPKVREGWGYYRQSSIARAAQRILSLLNDPQLAPEAADEIGTRMQQMSIYATRMLDRLESKDIDEMELSGYVRWTCHFLVGLAHELENGGIGDDYTVTTIARTMEDEARRLAEEAGIRLES